MSTNEVLDPAAPVGVLNPTILLTESNRPLTGNDGYGFIPKTGKEL
jgi:hypothetical protein